MTPFNVEEPLQIDCLDSATAFDRLQTVWQGLERQDDQCTPFNTWAWNSLWWHHYGTAQDRLTLLIARQGNRVVGIAPLFIRATRMCKVLPVHVLQFIGTGEESSPSYLNIIALRSSRDAAERAFLDFLPRIDGWHRLNLTHMLRASSLARRVREHVDSQPGRVLIPHSRSIQKAALPTSFDDCPLQPERERRQQINRRQEYLDAAGGSELCICATNDELVEASDSLVALHLLRRANNQATGGFRWTACEKFHRAVIQQFFAMDALWLSTLKLDGRIIGVQYSFVWRGELMIMHNEYSPEHESLSPEQVLFSYVIQRGIEQGMTGLNLLQGHHSCPSVGAVQEEHTIDLHYLRPGVRQLIGGALDRIARLRRGAAPVQDASHFEA